MVVVPIGNVEPLANPAVIAVEAPEQLSTPTFSMEDNKVIYSEVINHLLEVRPHLNSAFFTSDGITGVKETLNFQRSP